MKFSQWFALLKFHQASVWAELLFTVYYIAASLYFTRSTRMFSLHFDDDAVFILLVPLLSSSTLFLRRSFKSGEAGQWKGTPEFFFSKAIGRGRLFTVLACLYIAVILVPTAGLWVYSHVQPSVRVELPYNSRASRDRTRDFYLHHFPGAYLDNSEGNRLKDTNYVVLPKGKVVQAALNLIWVVTSALLLQALIFCFTPARPALIMVAYLLLYMAVGYAGISAHTPSVYEAALGWVSLHTLLSFAGLLIFAALVECYCWRRFVNTEVQS